MKEASAMALSLLELVTRAVEEEEDGERRKLDSEVDLSIPLQPSVTTSKRLSTGKKNRNDDYMDGLLIRESGEWCVARPSEEEESLVKLLKKKLEDMKNFTTAEFLEMLKPVLEIVVKRTDAESTSSTKHLLLSSEESNISDEALTLRLLKKAGPVLGRNLSASIVRCSLGLRFWSAIRVLLKHGLVSSVTHPQMVVKLVDERQPLLLCLCLHHVHDLPPSDIMLVLKFFLDEANVSRKSFEVARKDWRSSASAAIARAATTRNSSLVSVSEDTGYGRDMSYEINENRRAAIAFAAAVDGFSGWEVCLHDLVSAGQDEAVIAAVLRELDTVETMRLLRYLHKWLDRYSRKLAYIPFPPSCTFLPHKVPSLGQVLQWTSALFDVQYTRVVLTSDFFPELSALRALIEPLVAVGAKFSPLSGIIEHFRSNRPLPARKGGANSEGASDYIIEFLDFS